MVFKPITWPVSLIPLRVDNKLTLLLSQVAKTISPYNIYTMSSRKVMRMKKVIN